LVSILGWLLVVLLLSAARAEDNSARRSGPCEHCLASLPSGVDPRPLLVLLHGDGDSAAAIFTQWEHSAAARRVAVLALECPRAAGCGSRSWWRWNGSPAWITRQIAALSQLRPIDSQQLWIVGWSGGACDTARRACAAASPRPPKKSQAAQKQEN
jgi:poly(3-hydroxybutyrate) depolymerase